MLAYLPSLLTVAFIVLKLTDHIDWTWWLVLSPAWVTLLLIIALFLMQFIFLMLHNRAQNKHRGR